MNVVVYTALFGDIDPLWSPLPVAMRGARWVAFTDRKRGSQGLWTHEMADRWPSMILDTHRARSNLGWEVRPVDKIRSNRGMARYHKIMSHLHFPDADVTIWIDGNVRLRILPKQTIKKWLGKQEMATFNHNDRRCLFDEAAFCMKKGKGSGVELQRQVKAYREEGMPPEWGLAETKCIIRRNTEQMAQFNEAWWNELQKFSVRDQVSFPYVCWKLGLRWNVIPGRAGEITFPGMLNHAFWYTKHQKPQKGN